MHLHQVLLFVAVAGVAVLQPFGVLAETELVEVDESGRPERRKSRHDKNKALAEPQDVGADDASALVEPQDPNTEASNLLDESSESELKHVERVLVKALEEVVNEDQMKQAHTDDTEDDQSEREQSHSRRHSEDHDENQDGIKKVQSSKKSHRRKRRHDKGDDSEDYETPVPQTPAPVVRSEHQGKSMFGLLQDNPFYIGFGLFLVASIATLVFFTVQTSDLNKKINQRTLGAANKYAQGQSAGKAGMGRTLAQQPPLKQQSQQPQYVIR